ncbi:MAG: ABC transporter ATP-binding protein [Burkholderia sp.]
MTIAIDIRRVSKHYGASSAASTVLDEVSLQVREGEFLVLLGPSGCGKSTLLRMIAGLTETSEGEIVVPRRTDSRTHLGMVFQSYTSFPWLTVLGNLTFGPLLAGTPRREAIASARTLLERLGLSHVADCYPSQLSGGMQQRLAIGRALAVNPGVLLMDEPFGALDALTRLQMQALLTSLWRETGKTIVFVTHDIDEAVLLADRIVLLAPHPGRIDSVIEVDFARPRSAETAESAAFIGLRRSIRERILAMPTRR